MDSEDFERVCKNRRVAKRANASKASNLVLMPWEKRHQHTMARFLEIKNSSQTSVKGDQNYANSTLEENSCTDNSNKIKKCSGKSATENAEEDFPKNRNDHCDSLPQNHSCGASVSNGGDTIAPTIKVKPLQLLDFQTSSVSDDISQVKGGTAESKCDSVILQDLYTYKTYQEQKHSLCGKKVSEHSRRQSTSFTTTSGQAAQYNLNELFRYQCPKNRRPLREKFEFSISPSQNINSKHSNEERNLAFPRSFKYFAKYNMEEVFKIDQCKTEVSVLQILSQLS